MYETIYHSEDLSQYSFLVTGGAGFIGSNLVEYLVRYKAGKIRVLDNFATGFRSNLAAFSDYPGFELIDGDICDLNTCNNAVSGMDYVLHQAALGSVPRSINDPITTNAVNISGFLNILWAVKQNPSVKRMLYAASSSTYGDSKELPKVESRIGKPLSPYAVTKYVNELYADVFAKTYGIEIIGLRYFNVFGPNQSPQGAYAAAIPLFIKAAKERQAPLINGDGEQTRDFTFVENVIQANIKALFAPLPGESNRVFNVAFGESTSLNDLWEMIKEIEKINIEPMYNSSRAGDITNSLADISSARREIGYDPLFNLAKGLKITMTIDTESVQNS